MAALSDLTVDRPLAGQEIRLIRLKPSHETSDSRLSGDEHLECTIEYYRVAQAPPYTALSYCWGDSRLKRCLIVNGRACGIGINAVEALLHLQPQTDQNDDVHHFWIDQLCINQGDDAEKGRQVGLMWQIYSRAARVVAWLGLSGGDDVEFIVGHRVRVASLLRAGEPAMVMQMHSDAALLLRASRASRAFCLRPY